MDVPVNYIRRPFSLEERRLLREHFGIEEPGRLYLSDTSDAAYLNYGTERDPGAGRLATSLLPESPPRRRSRYPRRGRGPWPAASPA